MFQTVPSWYGFSFGTQFARLLRKGADQPCSKKKATKFSLRLEKRKKNVYNVFVSYYLVALEVAYETLIIFTLCLVWCKDYFV